MNKIFIIAKRDFFQTIGKRSFWISMLMMPIIISIFQFSFQSDIQKPSPKTTTANTETLTPQDIKSIRELSPKILAMASIFIYVFLISFSAGPLLATFSEEKENRVIEITLTLVKPKSFITGKILGHLAILLVQLIAMVLMFLILFSYNLGSMVNLQQIFSIIPQFFTFSDVGIFCEIIFFLGCAYLIIANLALTIAAAMPSIREGQRFIGYFILLGFLPLYFFGPIFSGNFSGPLVIFLSYFPFTSAIILLVRNVMGQISLPEAIFSTIILLAYVTISFIVAGKLFKLGAVEYQRKIHIKEIMQPKMK